jgi:hypothetical protein
MRRKAREEDDKIVRRALLVSDVPAVDDAALPGFYMSVWSGISAPSAAGTIG